MNDDDKGDESRSENTGYNEHVEYSGKRMTAPKEIKGLIERFQENRDAYRSSNYNEAQARIEFIDPFFKL